MFVYSARVDPSKVATQRSNVLMRLMRDEMDEKQDYEHLRLASAELGSGTTSESGALLESPKRAAII